MKRFPFALQRNQMDCGPTCLYIVCKYYGRSFSIEKLRELTEIGKEGVNILGISDAAEKIGYRTQAVQLNIAELGEAKLPCILHWGQNHFVVLHKIKKEQYFVADPGKDLVKYKQKEFEQRWVSNKDTIESCGIALLLEPAPAFYNNEYDDNYAETSNKGFGNLIKYLYPYKKLIVQLILGLMLGSLLQLIFPFLTQSIVDTGINTGNIHFITIILFAQLALFAGRLSVDFIKAWILYHVSSRINLNILTDFLIKLMKLPVSYFDSKKTGDILQRMNDHNRIQNFLTGTSLTTLFSVFNLVMFSVVLGMYNLSIFLIFVAASVLYGLWIIIFLKKRRQLDYRQFDIAAAEHSKTIQIVQAMQEIKLNGCEKPKRWEWERLQAKTFKLGMKGLALNQWQQTGAFFINEGKNIIITFLAATAVVNGQMTLGGMLAIQYIIGQLNSPIEQMIGFVQSWQLAKISLDRLNEIHGLTDEEPAEKIFTAILPTDKTIDITNTSFTYPGAGNEAVLKEINLTIQQGKTTAIVGTSGSGKTTLLKLLLKFYDTYKGNIKVGGNDIANLSHKSWRQSIGVVMQESFMFSDSIAANIALGDATINTVKLKEAASIANLLDFIESLPLGFNTKIGTEGIGISTGQKQRILIARAVYKNPDYVFFDEATNSLDANNETVIMKNLAKFFKGKTVIVVAHRLSTVKNADQIIVLHNGVITEKGTHNELANLRGEYYTLIKNQLEMGIKIMPEINDTAIKLFSGEVQEIISNKPHWFIRNGILLLCAIIICLLGSTFFIRYPDIVNGKAVLTSVNAPQAVKTKVEGKLIKLFVKEGQIVQPQEIVGFVESTANHSDVIALSIATDNLLFELQNNHTENISSNQLQVFQNLGEVQEAFQNFVQTFTLFKQYLSSGFYLKKKGMLQTDMKYLQSLHCSLLQQKKIQQIDVGLAKETFAANELLKQDSVISNLDYRNEKSKFLSKSLSIPQISSVIILNESNQHEKQKEILQLENDIAQQKEIFAQSLNTLRAALSEWKSKYLLTATIAGKIVFTNFLQENQQLRVNQTVCFINSGNTQYFAEVYIQQNNFGKVKTGQRVLLKLLSYPYQEFGTITGRLDFIADIATDSGYAGKITFPNDGLFTNFKRKIQYHEGLQAHAEIITADVNLSDRLLHQLRLLIK